MRKSFSNFKLKQQDAYNQTTTQQQQQQNQIDFHYEQMNDDCWLLASQSNECKEPLAGNFNNK